MTKNLVVIHGLNSTSHSFNYILEKFEPDWPGKVTLVNYDSHRPLREILEQVKRQLPKSDDLVLVGHSLGGVVAVLLAHDMADFISHVITISSPIGGSKAAIALQWLPNSPPILHDITPGSPYIKLAQTKPSCPVRSIITTGGHLPTSGEPNDSVVTVASQKASPATKKAEVRASHFEGLMHPVTMKWLKDFLYEEHK